MILIPKFDDSFDPYKYDGAKFFDRIDKEIFELICWWLVNNLSN